MLLLRAAVPLSSTFAGFPRTSPSSSSSSSSSSSTAPRCSSVGKQQLSAVLRSSDDGEQEQGPPPPPPPPGRNGNQGGIYVPRQRYIAVPKAALLDAVLSQFPSDADAAAFRRCAACLDAILHAEHKGMLEDMRTSYTLTQQRHHDDDEEDPTTDTSDALANGSGFFGITQEDGALFLNNRSLGLRTLLGLTPHPADSNTRAAFATQFQRSFMNLLRNAQFQELSAQDLLLTYALNTDYLLTLPIYVNWKRAAESNAIIFRRGYATERQKGLLLVEKLDYLQSKLLQNFFFSLSKPLKRPGKWLNEALKRSTGNQGFQIWIDKLRLWLKEQTYADNLLLLIESSSWDKLGSDQLPDADVPIWIAARKAVSRYEGILSPVGPRGRLLRRLLTWTGLIPSLPEATIKTNDETKHLEGHVRPNFLPRITLANIWEPASRDSCDNNVWEIVKASFRILFGRSTLQEPAFQELIILYTDETAQSEKKDKSEMLPLQLKIYEKIPIPDLPVVFPHKKLSFRILDTIRLDIATVIGLLAYVVNYKFESLASSPSAFLLDIVAISALLILVFRVALGYKQTRDRYQLLVNKTLYEKTLASGFGSVYFLLDASEQQQYKEALLAYAMLLCRKKYQVSSRASIRDTCEEFMYEKFKAKIEMPIDKAMETLVRLGLVIELPTNGGSSVIGLPCSEAYEILRSRWDSLLEHRTEQA
ncbi:unnamed protein product [Urochloa humidicola]